MPIITSFSLSMPKMEIIQLVLCICVWSCLPITCQVQGTVFSLDKRGNSKLEPNWFWKIWLHQVAKQKIVKRGLSVSSPCLTFISVRLGSFSDFYVWTVDIYRRCSDNCKFLGKIRQSDLAECMSLRYSSVGKLSLQNHSCCIPSESSWHQEVKKSSHFCAAANDATLCTKVSLILFSLFEL